jgi:hypothetical protein
VNEGSGLGVGRVNVGSGVGPVGLGERVGADEAGGEPCGAWLEPGNLIRFGRTSADTASNTTTSASPAVSQGDPKAERDKAPGPSGGGWFRVMWRV